jgi:hypothetical protein
MKLHLSTIQGLMIPPPENGDKPVTFFFDRVPRMCLQRAGRIIPTARDNMERELQDLSQSATKTATGRAMVMVQLGSVALGGLLTVVGG